MEASLVAALVMRWLHILSAIALVGSVLFYWYALRPVVATVLTEDQREPFRNALVRRWRMLVHPPILFFLISGFYNYLAVTRFQHEDQPLYHALFGVKFLLALGVFGLGIAVTSTRSWSTNLRIKPGIWAALLITSLAVVLIGGYMKVMPKTPTVEVEETTVVVD